MARAPRRVKPTRPQTPGQTRAAEAQWVEGLVAQVDAAGASPEAIDSLVVRLANRAQIGMHGRFVQDGLREAPASAPVSDDPKACRQFYQLSPYNLPSANAVITGVWRSPETDEAFVMVGRRWAKWRNPDSGISTTCVLPGGFMDPAPRSGAPADLSHDRNLDETAARELKEETGLTPPKGKRFRQVQTRSDFYEAGEERAHMIFADYLADFSGSRRPPRAVGDDDLAAVRWIPLADLIKVDGPKPAAGQWSESRYHVEIDGDDCVLYDPHGEALEATLRAWRDDELRRETGLDSGAVEATARRLEAGSGRRPYSVLSRRPETEVGPEAENWHRDARQFARRLTSSLDARAARLVQEATGEGASADARSSVPVAAWQPPLPGFGRR